MSIILDQQKCYEEISELPISAYSRKYVNKTIENGMVKDKSLGNEIYNEINRLTRFNRVWLILSMEVLLSNKNLKTKIK